MGAGRLRLGQKRNFPRKISVSHIIIRLHFQAAITVCLYNAYGKIVRVFI